MKSIFLTFNNESLEFFAKEDNKVLITTSVDKPEDIDLAYLKFINIIMDKYPKYMGYVYMMSSSIDHIVFDNDGFNWTADDIIINRNKVYKKGKYFYRKAPKGELRFIETTEGYLKLAME